MGLIAGDRIGFIHIPKCGGWSVKHYLCEHFGPAADDVQALVRQQGFPIGHVRLKDFPRFTQRAIDSFDLILAVVRNPYERELSQWEFWRDRWARGQCHIHDWVASRYGRLEEFLLDPRSDFHLWYQQNTGEESERWGNWSESYGGYYFRWLEVDGQIPDNVRVIRLEQINTALPALLQPFADHDLPSPDVLNKGKHLPGDTEEYYTQLAAALMVARYEWTWNVGLYPQWSEAVTSKLRMQDLK